MSVKARLSQPRVANQLGSHQCNAVVLIFAETEIDERHARIIIIQHNINKEKWWGSLVTDFDWYEAGGSQKWYSVLRRETANIVAGGPIPASTPPLQDHQNNPCVPD